ncbi:hypothetical protein L7F22_061214 [Adiantum nelumboides]|nr:hypothetical protein [Adiantum nelumboides]
MPSSHHPIGSKRPVLTKRISSGSKATIPRSSNSNISINNSSSAMNLDQTDISMLHIRERVINGNTGFGTPKARRERELRNKEKLQKAGSRRISNSIDGEEAAEMEVESDEWIDNEAGSNEEGSNGRMDDDQVLRRSSAQEEKTARRSAGRVSTSHHSSSIRERSSRSNLKERTTIKISATTGRSSNASAPRSSAKYDLSNSSRSRRSSGITSNSYTSNGNGHLDVNPTMRPSSSNDRLTSNFTNHRDVSDSRDESDQSDVVMKTFIEDDSLSRTKSDEQESNKENRRSRVARNDVQLERIPLPRKGREDTLNSKFSNLEVNKKELSPSKSASRLNSLTRRSDRDSSSNSSNTSKKISPSAKITASATGNLTRPALASRTTLPAVINQTALTEVPNYDLENDQDLPSPFLRKVNRLENEKFKPSSGGGLLARAAMNKAGLNAKSGIASSSSSTVGPSRVSMKAEKVGTVHSAPTSRIGSTSNSASRISSTQPIINRRQSTGTGILNTTPTLGSNASAIASGRISATSRPRISAVTSSTINREAPTRRR